MKRRKQTTLVRYIEAMLDFAFLAGFLSAIGYILSVTGRLVF